MLQNLFYWIYSGSSWRNHFAIWICIMDAKHYTSPGEERSGSLSQAKLLHILKGYRAARCVIDASKNIGFTAAWGKFFPGGIVQGSQSCAVTFQQRSLWNICVGIKLCFFSWESILQRWTATSSQHETQLPYLFAMRHKQFLCCFLLLFKGHFLWLCSSRLSYSPLKNLRQGATDCLGRSWLESSLQH